MTAEFHYRETYPKELRVQIQNEDELHFLRLLFEYTPKFILKKFTKSELADANITESWRKKFISEADLAEEGEPYDVYDVWGALREEVENLQQLEDASHI